MHEIVDAVRDLLERPWARAHASWLEADLLPSGWPALSRSEAGSRLLGRLWAHHFNLPLVEPFRLTTAAARLSILPATAFEVDVLSRVVLSLGRLALASESGFAAGWFGLGRAREQIGTLVEWREALRMARARPLRLSEGALPRAETTAQAAQVYGAAFLRLALEDGRGGLWPWLKFRFDARHPACIERGGGAVPQPRISGATARQVVDVWACVASHRVVGAEAVPVVASEEWQHD